MTSQTGLGCGVPQGSPVSPLLFMLYMTEPILSGSPSARFNYADYVGILGVGKSFEKSAIAVHSKVSKLLDWSD